MKLTNVKRAVAILLIGMLATSVFAGGGGESDEADGQVTISILTRASGSDPGTKALEKIMMEFEAANPNIKIDNISVSEEAAFNDKFKAAVATGEIPNIFYLPGTANLVQYAENDLIMDISVLFDDKEWYDGFLPGAFDSFDFTSYGTEGVYGIPYAVAPEYVFYNKDLFKKAGIDTFPETMDELYVAIDKLNAMDVYPFGLGAKDTWRAGHIHNQILYKMLGAQIAADLGSRKIKWTDPTVVETLAEVKRLNDSGAFIPNAAGISWDIEKSMFFNQESAMVNNGTWFLGDVANANASFEVGVALWPYYEDRPEHKGVIVQYPQTYWVKGNMSGAEYDATTKFVKFLTGQYGITEWVRIASTLPSRTDTDYDSFEVAELYEESVELLKQGTGFSGDSFDYDRIAAMQDVTRNAIVGMLLGDSPEKAAATIQAEIDRN